MCYFLAKVCVHRLNLICLKGGYYLWPNQFFSQNGMHGIQTAYIHFLKASASPSPPPSPSLPFLSSPPPLFPSSPSPPLLPLSPPSSPSLCSPNISFRTMVVSSPTQAVGAGISQGTRGQPNSPWIRN